MKKFRQRWYEKNESLRVFMALLEQLDIDKQSEIAIDIIVNASNMIDRDYTKIIQNVATFDPKKYKRWYDKNPNIHLAIESLKDLNDEQKEQIVKDFTEAIIGDKYSNVSGMVALDNIEDIEEIGD